MNRRHFCKIASLAAAAIGLGPVAANAAASPRRAEENAPFPLGAARIAASCRVTILRRECHTDLQALFLDDPDAGPCRNFASGEDFRFDVNSECPDGFCPRLWDIICAWTLSDNRCAQSLRNPTTIISCPDGTRPVIVRVDRTDD